MIFQGRDLRQFSNFVDLLVTYSSVTCVWKDMEIAVEIGSNPASKKQLTNGKPEPPQQPQTAKRIQNKNK